MSTLEVVVGGQYGSEAKGHITQRLTEQAQGLGLKPQVVRVAGPNAGHTGYDKNGIRWALRQVPVAVVTDGPAILGIAAGSEIDPAVLLGEIDSLTDQGLMENKHLWVSEEATIIEPEHQQGENVRLVDAIGSTGKGIGAARADRIWRKAMRLVDSDWLYGQLEARGVLVVPAGHILNPNGNAAHTIIEGTQGYALGLHAGMYPKCTSSDCRAQDFIAMAGAAPWAYTKTKIYVVARVYPIRVAGNSGPMKDETSWEDLGLPEEHTTVTKKVRRVGASDWDLVRQAVRANGGAPTVRVALTMLDQVFPEMRDLRADEAPDEMVAERVRLYLKEIQHEVGAPIEWVTTGPNVGCRIAHMEI